MNRLEYELLREQEPQLVLPPWTHFDFSPRLCAFVQDKTREQVIAVVSAKILAGSWDRNKNFIKKIHYP